MFTSLLFIAVLILGFALGFYAVSLLLHVGYRTGRIATVFLNEKGGTCKTFGDAAYTLYEAKRIKAKFVQGTCMSHKYRKHG